jgi:histidyl-tRNA synthetase
MSERKLVEPRTLKGFNDLMPGEALLKRRMLSSLTSVFESFGFCTIETPHLEFTEVLLGDASPEIQKQLFRFTDQGGRDVTLRFDLTVPTARYVSQYKNELGLPFKRYMIGNAFRGEKPQKGRYREFTQCDFDFLGATGLGSDCEVLQVIVAGLTALKIENFCIRINNRHLMNGLCEWLQVGEKAAAVIQVVDKIDKITPAGVSKELVETVGLSSTQAQALLDLVSLSSAARLGVSSLEGFSHPALANETFARGVNELRELGERLIDVGVSPNLFRIDFSIARGFGYYTGTVFETNLAGLPEFGSVCSGGRYDNLTQTFQREPISGIGASFGLDRLIAALQEGESKSLKRSPADVLVVVAGEHAERRAARVGSFLRENGPFLVDVFPEAAKIKKQLGYAERNGIRVLVFVRDDSSIALETTDGSFKESFTLDSSLIAAINKLVAR